MTAVAGGAGAAAIPRPGVGRCVALVCLEMFGPIAIGDGTALLDLNGGSRNERGEGQRAEDWGDLVEIHDYSDIGRVLVMCLSLVCLTRVSVC